ncbi:MAG: kinase [Thermoplasmata archaeon]
MSADFRLVVTKAPMRITFTGGGSDFPRFYRAYGPGAVVSAAINRYIYVSIAKNFYDKEYRISYSKTENAIPDRNMIEHPTVREALKLLDVKCGIQIISITEIPSRGTGLGSSSSFLVALLLALHTWIGESVTAETLAQEAYKIEREILNEPGGKQDQYLAAYGGINLMKFNIDDSVEMKPIIMTKEMRRKLEEHLLMFYTGIERSSASIHTEQLKNVDNHVEYYQRMSSIALDTYDAISSMNIERIAELMEQNWNLKKKLNNGISDANIEKMYQTAKNAGALAGKLMGAGGGGFMLFLVNPDQRENVINALKEYRMEEFKIDTFGSRIAYFEDY